MALYQNLGDFTMSLQERTRLRNVVESEALAKHRFRAGIPDGYKDELICWMEV